MDRSWLLRPCHVGAVERGHAPDQALAWHEDRPAVPVPDQLTERTPVWLGHLRIPIPGSARANPVAVLPQLLPDRRLTTYRLGAVRVHMSRLASTKMGISGAK